MNGPTPAGGPLRVLIVDDEPLARSRIAQLLRREGDTRIVAECGDARTALLEIERSKPDLVFLDVQMPEISGLELLRLLPADRLPQIVFVTAHDEFAIRAFDHGAVDYLLKPFTDARFLSALRRARERTGGGGERIAALAGELGRRPLERILVRDGDRVLVVRTAEIDWVEAEDYCVSLHVGQASHLLRQSLKQLEASLDPARFVRVHRGYLVNLDRVEALEPLGGGEHRLLLRGGVRLPVGPNYARGLLAALGR